MRKRQSLKNKEGYVQFEYIQKELSDLLDSADIVISRAGANAICELLALHKPNILIPLSLEASRGDQILNAQSFEKQGFSYVIKEEDLSSYKLLKAVNHVYEQRNEYEKTMLDSNQGNAVIKVCDVIDSVVVKHEKIN